MSKYIVKSRGEKELDLSWSTFHNLFPEVVTIVALLWKAIVYKSLIRYCSPVSVVSLQLRQSIPFLLADVSSKTLVTLTSVHHG